MNSLSTVVYHGLDETSFQSAPCPDLSLALYLNKSIEAIVDGIQNCCCPQSIFSRVLATCFGSASSIRESCPELNQTFTEYQIAPIHLAAMSQNLDAISELASRDVDLNAQDVHGFTPFHHMAVQGNLAGLKLLDSLGANTKLRTHDGGTAANFLKYTAPFRNPDEWKKREAAIRAHHEIDPTCLESEVAVVDTPVAPPQVLADIVWNFRDKMIIEELNPLMHRHLAKSHREFIKHPPQLKIRPSASLSSCGLFAENPIPKGSLLGYYGGEIFFIANGENPYGDVPPNEEYAMNGPMSIFANDYRSPAAMANDGFPNACFMPLASNDRGAGGLPYQIALVATEDIQPGEEILTDYGIHHAIKKEGHIETRKEALLHYFSKSSLKNLENSILSALPSKTSDEAFRVMDFIVKMNYLHATPDALQTLQTEAGWKDDDFERLKEVYAHAVPWTISR